MQDDKSNRASQKRYREENQSGEESSSSSTETRKTAKRMGQSLPSSSSSSSNNNAANGDTNSTQPPSDRSIKRVETMREAAALVNAAAQQRVYQMMWTDYFPPVDGGYQQRVQSQFRQFREHNTYSLLYSNDLSGNFFTPLIPPDEKSVSGANNLEPATSQSSNGSSSSVISMPITQAEVDKFIKEILQKRQAFDAAAESDQAEVLKIFLKEMQKAGITFAEYICAMTPQEWTTFLSCIEKDEKKRQAPTSVSPRNKSQNSQPPSSSSSSSNSQNNQQIVRRNGAASFTSPPKPPASSSSISVISIEPTQANINAFITTFLSYIENGHIEAVCTLLEGVDPEQRFGLTFDPIGNGTKKSERQCAFNVATKRPKIFAAMLDLVRPTEKEIFDLLISESYGKMVFHSLIESRNGDPEALRRILNSVRPRIPDLFHEFYKKTGRTPLFSLVNMCNILTSSSHCLGISVLLSFVDEDERMGLAYQQGALFNPAAAKRCFEVAAKNGHAEAQYKLGLAYLRSDESLTIPAPNALVALKHLKDAEEQYHPNAAFLLGDCYERGLGTLMRSLRSARKQYEKAFKWGRTSAIDDIARINSLLAQEEPLDASNPYVTTTQNRFKGSSNSSNTSSSILKPQSTFSHSSPLEEKRPAASINHKRKREEEKKRKANLRVQKIRKQPKA